MKIFLTIILILIFHVTNLFSTSEGAGVEDIFDYGAGARAMGLGNSYVSISDDSSAIYWNPAGLATLDYNELMFLHTTLSTGTYYDFLSFAYPTLNVGTFGLGIFRISTSGITFTDSHDITLNNNVSLDQMQYILGYGITPDLPFSFGTSFKINTFNLDTYYGANVAFDLGFLFKFYGANWKNVFGKYYLDNLNLGINIKNIVSTPMKLISEQESSELNIKTGVSYFYYFDNLKNHKVLATLDFNFYKDKSVIINTGLEYNLFKMFFLRTGYNQNIGLVIGGGIQNWGFRLDYSLAFQDINLVHRFSLLWHFGESIAERKAAESERTAQEIEERIKQGINEKTKEYQDRISKLEADYKNGVEKTISDLTNRFKVEKESLLQSEKVKSDVEKQKLINDLSKKYETEKMNAIMGLSNSFKTEREQLQTDYSNKLTQERTQLQIKIETSEKFKREHFNKGIELYEQGSYDEALAEFGLILRADPKYREANEYVNKIRAAKQKPATYSKEIMNLYYTGIDYYVAGDYLKAIDVWKKILVIDPYNKLAIRNINDAENKLNELNEIRKNRK